ncbi:hypothetical protein V2G26_010874 [Clonostachys chloroleuca]
MSTTVAKSNEHMRPFNHIGISVPDAAACVEWYGRMLGFQLIGPIIHISREKTPEDPIFQIYPSTLQEVKLAKMAMGNGVGFEIFEFINPKMKQATEFEYERRGFFHICITDPSPDALNAKFEFNDGKRISNKVDPSGRGYTQCQYLADPWGNVVEVLDVGFEAMACLSTM